MKVALYSPYLDTFGGGERYMMTIAEVISQHSEVDILLNKHLFNKGADYLKSELSKRFNLDLIKTHFILAPIGERANSISRAFFLKKYDLFFYLTDGSIFLPTAEKNILHIQSPIIGQPTKNLWGKIKLKFWDLIIYNSEFTQKFSKNNWPINSKIIYPPVDIQSIKPLKKRNNILSVGRFFGFLKDKKHELMIKAFIDLKRGKKINDWSLGLAGSAHKGDELYIRELKALAEGFPINFYPNLNFDGLIKLYGESTIYWHAAGLGENDPTKMEHFGISTVEAMAAGCIPVVIGKGGQLEIIENGKSGFLWNSLEEMKELTIKLILNRQLREDVSKNAIKRAKNFSKEKFTSQLTDLINHLS